MKDALRNLPLNPLRAFAIASRHRTFTAAAAELGVTQVAISRQIALLENYLGVQLYDRDGRSAKLTDVGRAYGAELAAHFDRLEAATSRLLEIERAGTIHLRVYPSVAHYWLLPRLSRFTARHPGLRVRMDTRVEPLDFRGTQLDVAIQLGHDTWRHARSRKLFDERIDAVGAPGRVPRSVAEIDPADMLHARYRRRAWRTWANAQGLAVDEGGGIEFDSSLLTYSAAAQGFGLAMGQIDLLSEELAAGRLVAPFGTPIETGLAFHVVWPATHSVGTHTRHFIDWLLLETGNTPEFFRRRGADGGASG